MTEVAVHRPARTGSSGLRLGAQRGLLEIKQFTRSRESVVFTLAFPVMLLVIFGSVFDQDVAPGIPFTEYFVGKVLMVLAIGAAETALLLALAFALYDVPVPGAAQWATFVWVALLGITACTLCGIAFSSLVRSGRGAPAVVTPVSLGLQFISGVFSLYTNLPGWMQQLAALFPLKWMTQGMRAVFLPASFAAREPAGSSELGRVALVLLLWCVGALVACLLTFRWTSHTDG